LLWYVVQHLIDRCRPHTRTPPLIYSYEISRGVLLARRSRISLGDHSLDRGWADGRRREDAAAHFSGRDAATALGRPLLGAVFFFPQNHRRRTARARPEHRGRQTNKISPGTLLPTHPCYSSPFPRNKEAEETTILLGAPHCSL
jgi:hypothetical protein